MSYREFWTVPAEKVAEKTGAVNADGVSDLVEVLAALNADLSRQKVIDVGCGTGRLATLCGEYVGLDVAPSQVEFARAAGLEAELIDGPGDLAGFESDADTVCCFSVFTHVPRSERQAYLREFRLLAARTVADVLPAETDGGGISAWYADTSAFESDLVDAGFENFDSYDRTSGDGHLHRYYLAW